MNNKNSSKTIVPVLTFLALILFGTAITFPQIRTNGKIAFTSDRDGNQEVYIMNNDGTGQARLTNNPGTDKYPTFSPDGRKIAFASQNTGGQFGIWVMNTDGTEKRLVTPANLAASPYPWHEKWSMSWSPDGSMIVFAEDGDIITVNVADGTRKNLTNHPADDLEPSWSPDGSRIVFASYRASWVRLHTMKADGSDVRELPTSGDSWDMSPAFAPDGNKIAFIVHAEWDLPQIYTANADGTDRRVFDRCGPGMCSTHPNNPRWSPDAARIVFHVWEYFSGDCQIYVKNIDGDGITRLTSSGRNFQPSWQPLISATRASIAGRILTPDGRGLTNTLVNLTDASGATRSATTSSFGMYSFSNVPIGEIVTISVRSKRYRFGQRVLSLDGNATGIDLIGLE